MKILDDVKLPLFMLLAAGALAALFFPFFPIDETRYLTVAWEMKLNHSIVPLLHGRPYAHKPPFLFALINLDWFLFGTNEISLRFIPAFFSMLNILLTYRIAVKLWKDDAVATYATIVLASLLIYLAWSVLIMFDIVLTFFVLLGIYGLVTARESHVKTSLLLVSLSIGGGLLTKGPVIFAHILPVSLLYIAWKPKNGLEPRRWYPFIVLSVLIGVALALGWAAPAAIKGGETYSEAILWGQTAGRLVSSFAHQHPIWWYIPILPGLLLPWILTKPAWSGLSLAKGDEGYRFLVVWMVASLAIFSLISGKQVYYLIPLLPALSLLIAKNMVLFSEKRNNYSKLHYPVAVMYLILGVVLLGLPVLNTGGDLGRVPVHFALTLACAFMLLGVILIAMKPLSLDQLIRYIAVSSLAAFVAVAVIGLPTLFKRYDVSTLARIIKEKQENGYTVVQDTRYDGQYQFLGRLTEPLTVLHYMQSVADYAETHDKVLVVAYKEPDAPFDQEDILYQQPYRGKRVILFEEKEKRAKGP